MGKVAGASLVLWPCKAVSFDDQLWIPGTGYADDFNTGGLCRDPGLDLVEVDPLVLIR
jgi:hypothetical protein